MIIKIALLTLVALTLIAPALLSGKFKYSGVSPLYYGRKPSTHWKGPKTDARINRMLAECAALMRELGVPISGSICPEVVLTGSRFYYGRCSPKGSLKRYNQYDYYIEISGHTLGNSEKSLRNTLIHELIHTVPGGLCHTGEWKKWANYVSEKTDFNIIRLDGDKTWRDRDSMRGYTDWLNA